MIQSRLPLLLLPLLLATLGLAGCGSMYYGTMEKLGVHKREILVDRVTATKNEQEAAKEEFTSALDAFMAVVEVEPSELQSRYDALKDQLDRCEDVATNVNERIDAVEEVAAALFSEWENELELYSSAELRANSAAQLRATRERYHVLIDAMRRAESKMEPVLVAFRDQVLYLKHNLNAQAVASLQNEVYALETEIDVLVREMQAAIEEATAFIESMESVS